MGLFHMDGIWPSRMLVWCISIMSFLVFAAPGSTLPADAPVSQENQLRSVFLVVGLAFSLYPLVHAVFLRGSKSESLFEFQSIVAFSAPAFCALLETLLIFQILFSVPSFHATLIAALAFLSLPLLSTAVAALFQEPLEADPASLAPRLSAAMMGGLSLLCAMGYARHLDRAGEEEALRTGHVSAALNSSNVFSCTQLGLLLALVVYMKQLALRRAHLPPSSVSVADRTGVVLNVFLCCCLFLLGGLALAVTLASQTTLLAGAESSSSAVFFCRAAGNMAGGIVGAGASVGGSNTIFLDTNALNSATATATATAATAGLDHRGGESDKAEPSALALQTCGMVALALCAYHLSALHTIFGASGPAIFVHAQTLFWALALIFATFFHLVLSSSFELAAPTWLALLVAAATALANTRALSLLARGSALFASDVDSKGDKGSKGDRERVGDGETAGGSSRRAGSGLRNRLGLGLALGLLLSCAYVALHRPTCGAYPMPVASRFVSVGGAVSSVTTTLPLCIPVTNLTLEVVDEETEHTNSNEPPALLSQDAMAEQILSSLPKRMQQLARRERVMKKLAQLRRTIAATYAHFILPKRPVALFAVPRHWNLGDSFIWLGQKAILDSLGLNVVYTCFDVECSKDMDNLSKVIGDGTIVINGGGNYGDIYRFNNQLVSRLLARFPRNRIVQLPQSVFYQKKSVAISDLRTHFNHPDFHLLVRDQSSYDYIQTVMRKDLKQLIHTPPYSNYSQRLARCPDSAIAIGPVIPNCEPDVDVVFLSRRDTEKVYNATRLKKMMKAAGLSFITVDWMADWQNVFPMPLHRPTPNTLAEFPLFRLHAGNNMLCRGRVIVSDRLHASILTLLMNRPFVGLDNIYHKMERVIELMFHDATMGPTLSEDDMNFYIQYRVEDVVPKVQELLRLNYDDVANLKDIV